jgi:hypothetical protein
MSIKKVASQIISDAMVDCIQKKLGACDILIVGLTGFDVHYLINKLGSINNLEHPIRLAIEGFGSETELSPIAQKAGFTINDDFSTELRIAGKWRNEWSNDQGTRIAIARKLPKRMNTLGQFVNISSTEIARQMLVWAATTQDFYMNQPHKHLFEVLQNEDDFAGQHVPHLIANYLEVLASLEPADRLTAVFQQLWRLRLLPDPDLFSGLEQRLNQNLDFIKQIQSGDQIHRSTLNAIIAQLSKSDQTIIENALQKIIVYQRNFDAKQLSELTLDLVADALEPRRVRDRSKKTKSQSENKDNEGIEPKAGNSEADIPPNKSGGGLTRKQFDHLFGEHILEGNHDVAENMTVALSNAITQRSAKEEKGTLHFDVEEQEITFHIDEKLLAFVRKFCSEENFGGILQSKEGTLRAAIDRLDMGENILFYRPSQALYGEENTSIKQIIDLFDEQFPNIGLKNAFHNFINRRTALLPFVDVLTIDPYVVVSPNQLDLFENYLLSASEIMDLIRKNYDKMREASDLSLQICLSQLIALDTVLVKCIVNNKESIKAILMPLHPMYLWAFIELIKIGDRIRTDPDCTEEDRTAFLNEMTTERFFLNTLFFTEFITGNNSITLPLAGSIELLACYENTSNHYSGLDGLEQFLDVIEHFCNQYRMLTRPLRIAIVDIPSVDDILARLYTLLNKIKRKDLPSVQLTLYFTSTGSSRNYISSMLSPENEQIYQELIASGRLYLYLSPYDLTLKEIISHIIETPVHILGLFDQSNVQQRGFTRTVLFNTSPLCITREFKHDQFRDVITARPVTNAPIFSAYDDFVRRLKNELANHAIGVIADASILKTTIEQALQEEGTQWLFLADRALPPESNLQAARLLASSANRRQILTLAKSLDSFARPLKELLDRFNLYIPTPEALIDLMQDFAHLISEGLLALSDRSGDFNENRQKGLLGMLLTARQYRKQYPESIIVSVDSPTAKQWLRISSEGREMRADLLGLRSEDDNFFIDVIEVKTHEGPLFEENQDPEENTLQKAMDQVAKTVSALRKVFVPLIDGESIPPLVPPRREVLRELFFQEIQSHHYGKKFRLNWVPLLNNLFLSETAGHVLIHGQVYEIALSKDIDVKEQRIDTNQNFEILHRVLGTVSIQKLLDGAIDSISSQSVITDEIRRVVDEGLISKSKQKDVFQEKFEIDSNENNASKANSIEIFQPEQAKTNAESSFTIDEAWLKRIATLFERSCGNFGIQVIECDPRQAVIGPAIVRFRFKIAEGQSKKKLDQYLEDIGREISISNILIKTLPDSKYLALDVPSPIRRSFSVIKDGLSHLPKISKIDQLPILIGQSPAGDVVVNDLSEMVHMLVGGSTRSGKTVFLYGVILSLLATHTTKESLELVLCTAKPEDFVFFETLPHLHDRKVIEGTLEAIDEIGRISTQILTERSKILRDARVTTVSEYNQSRDITEQIRPIVIIVDEFADLGDQVHDDRRAKDLFYTSIRQIAQAGRSRSVHLVLCTQRPTADLFPSGVKSQMNAKVALKVNSSLDSSIILGQDGAERLLGKGDMLFKYGDILERLQGYYSKPEEIEKFVKLIL